MIRKKTCKIKRNIMQWLIRCPGVCGITERQKLFEVSKSEMTTYFFFFVQFPPKNLICCVCPILIIPLKNAFKLVTFSEIRADFDKDIQLSFKMRIYLSMTIEKIIDPVENFKKLSAYYTPYWSMISRLLHLVGL